MQVQEVPDPTPAPDEVILEVAAAGLNRADLLQRQGNYPPPPGASEYLGMECSGTVAAVGETVAGWSVGDRACALLSGGGYAERVAVPVGQLMPVPGGRRPRRRPPRCPRSPAPCGRWSSVRTPAGCSPANGCWCTAAPAASGRWRSSSRTAAARTSSSPQAPPASWSSAASSARTSRSTTATRTSRARPGRDGRRRRRRHPGQHGRVLPAAQRRRAGDRRAAGRARHAGRRQGRAEPRRLAGQARDRATPRGCAAVRWRRRRRSCRRRRTPSGR